MVLPQEAAIFTDGRYTLQVRQQVLADDWQYVSVPATSVEGWLGEHAPDGGRIGYDPWLHTRSWVEAARKALAERGAELVAIDTNPIDAVWPDKPAPSDATLAVQDDAAAGKSSAAKRAEIADWLHARKADAVVLSALDSIAWAFNVRGQDVAHTAGRARLCDRQCRRHRRSVRRAREDHRRGVAASRQRDPRP